MSLPGMTGEPPPRHPAPQVPSDARAWLDVPFQDKDAARDRGARWDPQTRRWYAPRPGILELMRWAALPTPLPTEDRTFGEGLYVDLVPASSWFRNVRTAVSATDWYRIRTMVYARAGHQCETCGRRKSDHVRLDCHERFDYTGQIQRLRRLLCMCSACHQVTHFGHTHLSGRADQALEHLISVTGMTQAAAMAHIDAAFAQWQQRSAVPWILDLRMIEIAGVIVHDPQNPAEDPQDGRDPGAHPDGTSVTIAYDFNPYH
ncbi:MAG: DUF5710 domain-containing protein [Streptosporangiaceae bacterium]